MYQLKKNKKGQSLVEVVLLWCFIIAIVLAILPHIANQYQTASQTISDEIPAQANNIVQSFQ